MTWLGDVVLTLLASVLAIVLHEIAHGVAACSLGDDTARRAGRLTLNPIRHVDPVGTIAVPALLVVSQLLLSQSVGFIFGWAKPVPVDIWRLRPGPRTGMAIVAAAGPVMNFLLLLLVFLGGHATGFLPLGPGSGPEWLVHFVLYFTLANLVLGFFNLVPIPPLDGSRILARLLPAPLGWRLLSLERVGLLAVFLIFFLLPQMDRDLDPLGWMLRGVIDPVLRGVLVGG